MTLVNMRRDVVEPNLTPAQREAWHRVAQTGLSGMATLRSTCRGSVVIAGNGISQNDIPVEWLNAHTTFGVNYCHRREGFQPTYYLVGDVSVAEHEWPQALFTHRSIPMFLPSPGMDSFGHDREQVYRYLRVKRHGRPVGNELDPLKGLSFTSVVHAATLLAAYMGYTAFLYVGLDGGDATQHFYGKGYPQDYNRLGNTTITRSWDDGYGRLQSLLPRCTFLNLSTITSITTMRRDRWNKY